MEGLSAAAGEVHQRRQLTNKLVGSWQEWRDPNPQPPARRWRRLADEYIMLAEQLDAKARDRTPILHPRPQRQPVQQQQAKSKPDEKT